MPNHVTNELHFHHCTEDRFHEILKDIQSDEAGLGSIDFRKLIPEPEGLYMGDLGIEEMKRYKDNNWYDWRMKNWNTKWPDKKKSILAANAPISDTLRPCRELRHQRHDYQHSGVCRFAQRRRKKQGSAYYLH